ncbi:MAG: carboxypeptidase regulatory-like domain-containing protein [Alphaproteobacteria bacterium]|nr:carboxypeptidase regulatory-like domain-containing protein [Alphaproteobacteria bacterium]MCB9695902.1 carboxypeptidase regulatory-like domain-containing protein [Alphaproteobacteria bacterium]
MSARAAEVLVLDEVGAPVGGARVFVYVGPKGESFEDVFETVTDADGRVAHDRIDGLRVEAPGFLPGILRGNAPSATLTLTLPGASPEKLLLNVPTCNCPTGPVRLPNPRIEARPRVASRLLPLVQALDLDACRRPISTIPECPVLHHCPLRITAELAGEVLTVSSIEADGISRDQRRCVMSAFETLAPAPSVRRRVETVSVTIDR